MLISILGDIIDTEDIYKIDKIKGNNCFSHSKHLTTVAGELTHNGYFFKIHFFNRKTLEINLFAADIFSEEDNPNWYHEEDYPILLGKTLDIITELRNNIVNYWNKSKTDIPQIEWKS